MDNLSNSVDHVISFRTGSVSNDNGNVNGNADLADCKTLSQLWAEWTYFAKMLRQAVYISESTDTVNLASARPPRLQLTPPARLPRPPTAPITCRQMVA